MKTWSTSQSTLALSSGEAELYALTKAATQLSGVISLAADFGVTVKGTVRSDSNAAIGITHRTGLGGRCRHIKVQYLWIQERVRSGDLRLKKVNGIENSADLMTKAVNGDTLAGHMKRMGFEVRRGRAQKASELNQVGKTKKDKKKESEEKGKIKKAAEEKTVHPQLVRVHDENGRQVPGRRWVTAVSHSRHRRVTLHKTPVIM